MILSQPVSTVLMPRMARLHAEGKREEMIQTYRNTTQLVSVVAGSASIVIAFFAEQLLYAWTGDQGIADNAGPILRLYVLGYGVLAIAAFPYYLQYALGNLKYHLIGNLIIVMTLIPAIVWAASHYGAVGAGWAWLGINSLYLVAWVGYVHKKLEPGLHVSWLMNDILNIFLVILLIVGISSTFDTELFDRVLMMVYLMGSGFLALVVGSVASPYLRRFFVGIVKFKK